MEFHLPNMHEQRRFRDTVALGSMGNHAMQSRRAVWWFFAPVSSFDVEALL
jgi:hypothetical protein